MPEKDEQRYGNQRRDRQRQGPVRGPEPVPGADAGHRQKGLCPGNPGPGGGHPLLHGVEGRDREGPTGTGKTFAFGIPMVEHADPQGTQVTGLVLAPTRELAIQIRDELRDLCAFKEGVRTVCLYGGQPSTNRSSS